VYAACSAKNELSNVRGYSPVQWVLVKNQRPLASILAGEKFLNKLSRMEADPEYEAINRLRMEAKRAFFEADADKRLRRAMLARSHPWHGTYEIGEMVFFWRPAAGEEANIQMVWTCQGGWTRRRQGCISCSCWHSL
jgi:hypothetical protein